MAPPNEKPNTLHSAFTFRDGKFLSVTHGPTKDQGSLKNARRRFHACDARGLASETSISDRFFINAAILFLCGRREAREDSQTFVFHPLPSPPSSLCRFCPKEKKKTAKVKSPQSTSNRRSSPFLPVSFSSDSGCPLAPVACFSPLSNSDVGHFTFVTSKTRDCP